jgi:hypothetical protein
MTNFSWNGMNDLEIVEHLAELEGMICSEEALSERFDEQIAPSVIEQYGENDEPAINEAFNDWTDSLCKEGEIHSEQYDKYEYVGEYS